MFFSLTTHTKKHEKRNKKHVHFMKNLMKKTSKMMKILENKLHLFSCFLSAL